MSKFKVGTRVGTADSDDLEVHNPDEDTSQRGEVVGINEKNGHPFVQWDDSYYNEGKPEEIHPDDLLLESDLEAQLSKLEQEYEAIVGPIQDKVAEAAKLLNEASQMADAAGRDLADMRDVVSPMMGAMRNAGWRTSALRC